MDDPFQALVPWDAPAVTTREGPLAGARLVVKDVIDVAGTVTGAGNPDWASAQLPAAAHATAVEALTGAGAQVVGKGRCAELAFSLSGDNAHYGMPINAAAPDRDPGGSTSGPAAAVAGELCELGLGTDTLGSIRVPASYCGLFGYRPTFGAIEVAGVLPLAQRFDTVGLLAREPDLLARAAEILLGPGADEPAQPQRLLLATDALAAVEAEIADATREAADRLAGELGTTLEWTAALPAGTPDLAGALDAFSVLQGAEVWRNFGAWIEDSRPSLGPDVASRIERASRFDADQVAAAEPVAAAVRRAIARLREGEALILPAAGAVAPPRDAGADARQHARLAAGRLTCVASLAGAPSISMPLAEVDGLPLGIALVGPPGSDRMLIAAARRSAA